MRCAIHQPQFLPWLGHFQKIAMSDVFVFLDNVQFQKNEFQNRNRIPTARGDAWLTVPVSYDFGDPINEVRIADHPAWRRKLLGTVRQTYAKAPGFQTCFPELEALVMQDYPSLADINMASVRWLMAQFEIVRDIHIASALPPGSEERTGRLVDICRAVGATTYLSGSLARRYLDLSQFAAAGITVEFQSYDHPTYPQQHGADFVSHMSALDALLCHSDGRACARSLNLAPAPTEACI